MRVKETIFQLGAWATLAFLLGSGAAQGTTCAEYVALFSRPDNFADTLLLSAIAQDEEVFNEWIGERVARLLGKPPDARCSPQFYNPRGVADPHEYFVAQRRLFTIATQRELDRTYLGKHQTPERIAQVNGDTPTEGLVLFFSNSIVNNGDALAWVKADETIKDLPRVAIASLRRPVESALLKDMTRVVEYEGYEEFPEGIAPEPVGRTLNLHIFGGPCDDGMGKLLNRIMAPALDNPRVRGVELHFHSRLTFVTRMIRPPKLRHYTLHEFFLASATFPMFYGGMGNFFGGFHEEPMVHWDPEEQTFSFTNTEGKNMTLVVGG